MKKLTAIVLVLVLLLNLSPVLAAGDAMSSDSLKTLLNSQTLHPQITGYLLVDSELEKLFAPYEGWDNYSKLKALYDWTARKVQYTWAPYSQDWAPAYDCFVPKYYLEYTPGLQESIPFEIINRSYHVLSRKEGICYDYAAVFAVIARYMGFEAYVHTGDFTFEQGYGSGSGHHGWTVLVINGKNYIFDPQRDYRMSANGTQENPYKYFGIDEDHDWRYDPETKVNAARDAQFLSVTAPRKATLKAETSGTGSATGSGTYVLGQTVTVETNGDKAFLGWYDEKGKLLSREKTFSITLTTARVLRAVYEGEYFKDIAGQWYAEDATAAFNRGLVDGSAPFAFQAGRTMSRAMAMTMLYRMVSPQSQAPSAGYSDVPAGIWYETAINWGTKEGIVQGVGSGRFAPNSPVTREQFVTMLMRLMDEPNRRSLPYTDSNTISSYAKDAMEEAQALGLLKGYTDGTLRPQKALNRGEGVTLIMRVLRLRER
ncbi:MAG: S-layer homology domain-containing protein [Oscillospiraceae bacterium]|nr:S-layer homology domain-containing protein [Oscillospiraceae bacterium]